MDQSPSFTIVLSGYQTEPYLPQALDSVSNQTFRDFEAICYVEESTDRSLEICQEHARKDSRFKVVSAPKSGAVATTRNYAIDHAAGKYLVVLDGDDWLSVHLLEKLHRKLSECGDLDVIAFNALTIPDGVADLNHGQQLTNFRPKDAEGVFTGEEAIRRVGRNGGQIRSYTWLNAYRTAYLRENRFYQTDGRVMEDFEWLPRVWFSARTFSYINDDLYIYRRRENSLTTEKSSRLLFDLVKQVRSLLDFSYRTEIPEDLRRIWSEQWISTFYWFMFHPVSSRKIDNADRRDALKNLFAAPGLEEFKQLAASASRPKKLALPLLRLAAGGLVWPAKWYFQLLYYPLSGLRNKKKTVDR
ncbi:MAG: glycosyltransferase [Lentisphaerae bacterium]|nr:glycosyltransferase [Lentisphaerota bacterium]